MLKKITYTVRENGRTISFYEITFQENEQIFCAYKLKGDKSISALMLLPSYASEWKKRFLAVKTSELKWSREEKDSSFLSMLDGDHAHKAYEEDQRGPAWEQLVSLLQETAMVQPLWFYDMQSSRKDPSWQNTGHKAYTGRFHDWYCSLSPMSQAEVQKMYPEPAFWKGYWHQEDREDIVFIDDMPLLFLTRDGSYQASTKGTFQFHSLSSGKELLYFNACCIERKLENEKKKFMQALKEDHYLCELLSSRFHLTDADGEMLWKRSRLMILISLLYPVFRSSSTNIKILLSTGSQKLLYTCSCDAVLSESGENLLGKALVMIREDLSRVYSFQKQILIPEKPVSARKDPQKAAELIQHAWSLSDQEGMEENALEEVHHALKLDPENGEGWLLAGSLSSQLSMAVHGVPDEECGKDLANAFIFAKEKAGIFLPAAETLLAWIHETMDPASDPNHYVSGIINEIEERASLYQVNVSFAKDRIFSNHD